MHTQTSTYPITKVFNQITRGSTNISMPYCFLDATAIHKYIFLARMTMIVTKNL